MSKKQIPTVWKWLEEITYHKTPIEDITEDSWDSWNSYTVNRSISMQKEYIELANYVQSIPYDQKKQIYQIYKEMLPKRKVFLKWIKSTQPSPNPQLVEHVASYYEVGHSTAIEYISVLKTKEKKSILESMGVDEKEQKKLLK
jgi:hypothetical protein